MSFAFRRKPGSVSKPRRKRGVHRSKFETRFDATVKDTLGVVLGYETTVLAYITAPQKRRYTPDWTIKDGWYIETKGRLDTANRKKMLYIKEQHPAARILVLFQNSRDFIRKGSKTRYSDWCEKNQIEWCDIRDQDKWLLFIKEALAT